MDKDLIKNHWKQIIDEQADLSDIYAAKSVTMFSLCIICGVLSTVMFLVNDFVPGADTQKFTIPLLLCSIVFAIIQNTLAAQSSAHLLNVYTLQIHKDKI